MEVASTTNATFNRVIQQKSDPFFGFAPKNTTTAASRKIVIELLYSASIQSCLTCSSTKLSK